MSTHHPAENRVPTRENTILTACIAALLALQIPLQVHFLWQIGAGHPVLWCVALLAIALTAAAIYGLVRQRAWVLWPALCAMTWSATILLEYWSLEKNRSAVAGLVAVAAAYGLLLLLPAPKLARPTLGVRLFYAAVASLTSYVAFWGLAFPNGTGLGWSFLADSFDGSLPFNIAVPALHARVIGALYLAATVVCVLNIVSRSWDAAWLGTWMILLWTGSILGITLTHLDFFDWAKPSVWFWFVAYVGFPAVAAWVLMRRTAGVASPAGRQLATATKIYLAIQGVALIGLACVLQLSPTRAAAIWPWAIIPLLSRFYSAPLVTFGLTSLVATRCKSGSELRSLALALAVMAASLLAASCLHRDKFNFAGPAAWIWFGSLILIGIANLTIAVASCWSVRKALHSPQQVRNSS